MELQGLYIVLLTIVLLQRVDSSLDKKSKQKLLVLLIDGFRWNYFDKFTPEQLPGFSHIRENGVAADYMISDVPTQSYPNYYSIMTGLHVESHGMVNNNMWDPRHNESFWMGSNKEQYNSYWWEDGDPLWITATKQGKSSYLWYWPGCEVEIHGLRPKFCSAYQDLGVKTGGPTWKQVAHGMEQALVVLKNGSADFAAVYVEAVDHFGHLEGPDGPTVKQSIKNIDQIIHDTIQKIDANKDLSESVNFMLFSDHGMMGTSEKVNLWSMIKNSGMKEDILHAMGSGPVSQIWPKPGSEEQVYEALKNKDPQHLRFIRKEDIPEEWHLKNHYRIAPILVLAAPNYALIKTDQYFNISLGNHGFDNTLPDMRAIFYAIGPDMKKKYKKPGFANVELYQLMCHILGVQPSAHNGTWSHIADVLSTDNFTSTSTSSIPSGHILKSSDASDGTVGVMLSLSITVIGIFIFMMIIYFYKKRGPIAIESKYTE